MPIIQHLVVDQYGSQIGRHSERLIVSHKGQKVAYAPLLHLESVTIANQGITISADAVRDCSERGIPIYFISSTGTPYASLYSAGLTGTVATRRAQLAALTTGQSLQLALAFCMGKLQNQANLLKYIAKYRKETDPDLYATLRDRAIEVEDHLADLASIHRYPEVLEGSASVDSLRFEIMGLEGRAAQRYWSALALLFPVQYGFSGRTGRGATDPLNCALNYGYGILYGQVERCLVLAGLDPYAGFLHVDRPGKPSLTLDMIEEFRQPVIDRTVVAMANKNMGFEQDERKLLTQETRRTLAEKVIQRLESEQSYDGKRYPLRMIIQMQARRLAAYLRCERTEYIPYTMSW